MRNRQGDNRRNDGGTGKPTKSGFRSFLFISGIVVALVGAGLGLFAVLAPDATEAAYGDAKVAIQDKVQDASNSIQEATTGQKAYPTVKLGVHGTQRELDRCDGTFTEMKSYEQGGLIPVWAAHNNCGGDVILSWNVGDEVKVAGDDTVYKVVEIRYTSKIWSSTADIRGIQGQFALQSCFYGQDRMKFVGLQPVANP